jgi:hypothetical protein
MTASFARAEKAAHDQLDELVGAVAHDDVLGGEAVTPRQRHPKIVGAAVGVAVEMAQRVRDRLEHPLRGRERILVGGELDDVGEAELALELLDGLPGLVGGDPEDVFVGDGFPGHGHERLLRPPGRSRGS